MFFLFLSFLWQLQGVTDLVFDAEKEALHQFASGPGYWATLSTSKLLWRLVCFPKQRINYNCQLAEDITMQYKPLDFPDKSDSLRTDVSLDLI